MHDKIAIIGLGYVGLPTAIGFNDAGFNVWGVDVSQRTVDMVRAGENPTGDPDVDDIIPAPGTERWNITTSTAEAVPHCDVVLVTVPTPITHDLKPDLSYVAAAGRAVFEAIPKDSNTIVVLESTVYPGVTAQTWLPIIEELGLVIGDDVEIGGFITCGCDREEIVGVVDCNPECDFPFRQKHSNEFFCVWYRNIVGIDWIS